MEFAVTQIFDGRRRFLDFLEQIVSPTVMVEYDEVSAVQNVSYISFVFGRRLLVIFLITSLRKFCSIAKII